MNADQWWATLSEADKRHVQRNAWMLANEPQDDAQERMGYGLAVRVPSAWEVRARRWKRWARLLWQAKRRTWAAARTYERVSDAYCDWVLALQQQIRDMGGEPASKARLNDDCRPLPELLAGLGYEVRGKP